MPRVFVIVTLLLHVVAEVSHGRRTRMLQISSRTSRIEPRAEPTDESTQRRVGYPSSAIVGGPVTRTANGRGLQCATCHASPLSGLASRPDVPYARRTTP